jgi:hypothetical protein
MRAAIVRAGVVENVTLIDPELQEAGSEPLPAEPVAGEEAEPRPVVTKTAFDPGEGAELVALADDSPVSPGWTYDGETFAPPPAEVET